MIKFIQELSPPTGSQILDKANRLAANALALLTLYGIVFFCLDYSMGFINTAFVNLTLIPLALIAIFLLKSGKAVLAKVIAFVGGGMVISLINLMFEANIAVICFFIPLLLSLQVIFQDKEKIYSRSLLIIGLIVFVILLFSDYRIQGAYVLNSLDIKYQIAMNLLGSMIFSLMIANFILKVNSDISTKLYNQGEELMNKNALLNSTLETKDKLLAVVSHDLRSPFLAIEASIEMLNDPDTEETERRMILNSLNRKSESTLALLNNLLLWSQRQTDAIKFEPEPIYLDELEATVNGVLRMLAEEKKLTLNIDFEPGIAVFADRNMLDSIIRNLISNAVKFSNNGSSIDLIGQFEDGLVIFTVQDYGVGMNEHVVKKLRQKSPFTIDGTQKETGHGIGLVLVHQFISAHESELQVSSEKGEGTMFQFKLKAVSG